MHGRVAVVALVVASVVIGPGIVAGSSGADRPGIGTDCEFPVTVIDAGETEVAVPAEPSRVVTLNPSAAQTMWEIGGREKVVGVTKYASYLEGAGNRTIISAENDIVVFERVIDLRPDLVLAPSATPNDTVATLREAGLRVYHFREERTVKDVYAKVRLVGQLTGQCEGAARTTASMRSSLEAVNRTVEGRDRPAVLYVFFGYTAGDGTFIHELIELAGGDNIAAMAGIEGYHTISPEVVAAYDPEWIVVNSRDPALPDDPVYERTRAGRRDRIVVVPIEHLNQPGPRIVDAVTRMATSFHGPIEGDAQRDADELTPRKPNDDGFPSRPPVVAPLDDTTAENATGTDDGTATRGSRESQPGLGPVTAALALALALVVFTLAFALRPGRRG